MVATVKVIPFAVPRPVLTRALAIIGDEPIVRVEAFRPRHAGLIITRLPQTKAFDRRQIGSVDQGADHGAWREPSMRSSSAITRSNRSKTR